MLPSSRDHNPLDYATWGILESKTNATSIQFAKDDNWEGMEIFSKISKNGNLLVQ